MSFTPLPLDLIQTLNADTTGLPNTYLRSDGEWSSVTELFGNVNQITSAESNTLSSTALPNSGNFLLTNRNDSLFVHGTNTTGEIFGSNTASKIPFFINVNYKNKNINNDSNKWYNTKTKKCYYSTDTLLFVDDENVLYAKGTNKNGILEKSAPGETHSEYVLPAMVPTANSLNYIVIDPDKTNLDIGKGASPFELAHVIIKEQDDTNYGRWIVTHNALNSSFGNKYGRNTTNTNAITDPVACGYTGTGAGYAENLWIEKATSAGNRAGTFHNVVGATGEWYIHSLISNGDNTLAIVKKTDDSESELWIAGGNSSTELGQGSGFQGDDSPSTSNFGTHIHIPVMRWNSNPPSFSSGQWSFIGTPASFTITNGHGFKNYDRVTIHNGAYTVSLDSYYVWVENSTIFRLYSNPLKVQNAVLGSPVDSDLLSPDPLGTLYYQNDRLSPKEVYTFTNDSGSSYTVLTTDDKLFSWGSNFHYQLNTGGTGGVRSIARQWTTTANDIDRVWVGRRSTFYTKKSVASGRLFGYGNRADGLLGDYTSGTPKTAELNLTNEIDSNLNNNDWEIANVFVLDTSLDSWGLPSPTTQTDEATTGSGIFIIFKRVDGTQRNRIYVAGHNLYGKLGLSKYISTGNGNGILGASADELITSNGLVTGIKYEEIYFPEDPTKIVQVNNGEDYTIISCKDNPTDRHARTYFAGNAATFGLQPLINTANPTNNIIDQFTRFDHLIPTSDPTY